MTSGANTPRLGPLTDQDVNQLTWKEIGTTAHFIARARTFFFPVLFTLALLLVLLEPDPWRVWLFGAFGVATILILIRDYFWLRESKIAPHHILYVITTIVVFQSVLIAVTGGSESPFFVIYVPMAILPSLVIGRPRPFVTYAAIPLTMVWFFTLGGVTGLLPRLTPDYWGQGAAYGTNVIYACTRATVYTFGIVLGGTIGLFLRQALTRSVRRAVEARQELVVSMQERNRDLLSLSGELAHELKNPLASIQGLSGLMAKKLPEGSKEAEQMAVLISEVKRMGASLDEFLNFSRPISRLAVREVHPAELLADVSLMHEGIAHQREVRLEVDPGDATPIRCDPRKVKQVLMNLLQNALDATPRTGRVTLRTEHVEDGRARLIVEDTGPGLAPDVRGRLFTPGATTKADGTGLGLTIARGIAEQHGGTLTLEARGEGGCRATLELPKHPPEANGAEKEQS